MRAGDELGGLDEMRRAARMQHRPRVRQLLHQLARAAGVVQVHVREENVVHRLAGDAEPSSAAEQIGNGMRRADVDERGPAAVLDDVRGREPGPHVFGIDGTDAVRMASEFSCDMARA